MKLTRENQTPNNTIELTEKQFRRLIDNEYISFNSYDVHSISIITEIMKVAIIRFTDRIYEVFFVYINIRKEDE